MSLLGLDIGTSGCKAIVFNEEGKELSRGFKEYRLLFPDVDKCELDPREVWNAIDHVMRMAACKVKGRDPVKAIGISALADAVTPMDAKGRFLGNTVVGSSDRRAISQAEWIEKNVGKVGVFKATGVPVHSMYTVPKIMWFKKNLTEMYENTWKFAGWPEIVHLKLGLNPKTDLSMASRSMGLNIKTKHWDLSLMKMYDIDCEKLFPLAKSFEIVGEVQGAYFAADGIAKNAAVAAGGFDQCCASLGVGLTGPGIGALTLGTCGVVTAISEHCVLHDSLLDRNHGLNIFVLDERYASFGIIVTAGSVLRWYREEFCKEEIKKASQVNKDPYEYMINSSPDTPSSVFVLPYFAGTGTPWFDPNQKGSVFGLTLNTSRLEILKGILDCICYELKLNIESMQNAGLQIESLRAIGGGAKSEKWMQLIADVVGLPIEVTGVTEAGCLGVAFLAGLGSGTYSSQNNLVELIKVVKVFEPRKSTSVQYEPPYQVYKMLSSRVKGLSI